MEVVLQSILIVGLGTGTVHIYHTDNKTSVKAALTANNEPGSESWRWVRMKIKKINPGTTDSLSPYERTSPPPGTPPSTPPESGLKSPS